MVFSTLLSRSRVKPKPSLPCGFEGGHAHHPSFVLHTVQAMHGKQDRTGHVYVRDVGKRLIRGNMVQGAVPSCKN